MRLVEIPAISLKPGMFVAELDRPWLETPFAIQGFVVRDRNEIEYISKYVNNVYVDIDYAGSRVFLPNCASDTEREASFSGHSRLKADFQQAKISFESASQAMERVFKSMQSRQTASIQAVRQAIRPLVQDIFKNKEAATALAKLKSDSDYRYHHSIAMAVWGGILGRQIGLLRDELEKLMAGCAMCDLGMTKLPQSWAEQPEPLSEQQKKTIAQHPLQGIEMVQHDGGDDMEILAIIEYHHERHDGSGYPHKLAGNEIPLLARIAGLVDSYDAMITPRPYASTQSSYRAIQELIAQQGKLFQASLVDQFVQAVGMFPAGSLVKLNTGEVAIVTRQNRARRLRPELVVVLDENKQKLSSLKPLDLGDENVNGDNAKWIVCELAPGSYGITSEEYFI